MRCRIASDQISDAPFAVCIPGNFSIICDRASLFAPLDNIEDIVPVGRVDTGKIDLFYSPVFAGWIVCEHRVRSDGVNIHYGVGNPPHMSVDLAASVILGRRRARRRHRYYGENKTPYHYPLDTADSRARQRSAACRWQSARSTRPATAPRVAAPARATSSRRAKARAYGDSNLSCSPP